MQGRKFIVVSNRLPVTVSKQDGQLEFTPSSGGLATAMSSVSAGDMDDMLWVGWPGITSDDLTPADKRQITSRLRGYGCAPVFLTAEQVQKFYEGYSNETLWPLFHYFQATAQFDNDNWQSYKSVNSLYAKAVLKQAGSDSTIWVHDYHLVLLPGLLRVALPDSAIGFFLHIPFPSFEIFRLLPERKEILEGLLGADLVGFHVYDYVRHFKSSVLRVIGSESNNGSITHRGRTVRVDAFPIGIDYEKFKSTISSREVQDEIKVLNDHYHDQKIILSVDRLDYSKGILQRLEAFEKFLEKNPKSHKKVCLVVIAVPSRTEVDAYKDLRESVEQAVSRINGNYGAVDWVPISYQFQNQPFHKLLALYAQADVALVTPVRDGMNLVAKEFVASQQEYSGVLILSELAGAIDELPEALAVNPNDNISIVRALGDALKMTKYQKKARLKAMQRRISSYNVQRWAADFLEQLALAKSIQSEQSIKVLNNNKTAEIIHRYRTAKKRLLILDYDGSLIPFVNSALAEDAAPGRRLLNLLKRLSGDSKNNLAIVSGRHREALDTWFGKLPINLAAEHGYWIKHDGKWVSQTINTSAFKQIAMPLLIRYTERTPGAVIEDKHSSLVWHYRNVTPELAYVRKQSLKRELKDRLDPEEAEIFSGSKILEIKPSGINKGAVVKRLLADEKYDFILCCGDDYTDEDMFAVLQDLPDACTLKVGTGDTNAKYQLASVGSLLGLLLELINQESR